MLLRGTLNQDWIKALPIVIKSLNNTPLKKLGWIKPSSIHSEVDSARVFTAKKQHNIESYSEPPIEIQKLNQQSYENSSKELQVNDFVYLDFDEKLFDKSFNVSVQKVLICN